MSEEKNEMVMLMKELVDRVKSLEKAVYDKDNLLMKSGFVVHESPKPHIENTPTSGITTDTVGEMSWDEIHKMAGNLK
tara:strand:+ start:924 stop:1157 length:234 start_codon:yes stop_codon:yes gene_type:complete